jgi:hypothetical protein
MRCAWGALLLAAHVAYAQPTDLTHEFQAGIDAFRLGKLDEARAHLEKARELDPKLPGPYRFLAAVAQAQGKWTDCIDNAHQALVLKPTSTESADTKKLYESCRVSAGRTPYLDELGESAAIAVTTNVPGATVKINGLTYGGTPLAPRPIAAGELEIRIEKAGWKPQEKTVTMLAGIVTDVIVELEPDPNAQIGPAIEVKPKEIKVGYLIVPPDSGTVTVDGAQTPQTGQRIELDPGTHVIELAKPGKDPWRRRVRISAGQKTTVSPTFVDHGQRERTEHTGLYVLGAGGAVLAGGFVAAMIARDAASDARDIVRIERSRDPTKSLSETGMAAPVRTRADLQDARDRHAKWSVISNALYVTGIITSGVGAYFLYKGARQRHDVPPPFAIAPVEGGAMIAKEIAW